MYTLRTAFAALALLVLSFDLYSQVTIGSNNPPDASAVLDVQSSTGGILYPRLTTAQRNAIVNPAIGLSIYNTTTACVQVYFPMSGWQDVRCDCQSFPSSAFTFPNSITTNVPANLVASTSGMTYSWTFQSGSPATGTNQTEAVTWSSAGTYAVTLTVTDQLGCSSTTTQNVTVVNCPPPYQNSTTFSFTGSVQTWTVPACATSIIIDARGAQGGTSTSGNGGLGGRAQCTLAVTPGAVLNIYVGGTTTTTTGGYNGGGNSGNYSSLVKGGGGASDIRIGGTTLNDRVIVASGGGGVGFNCGGNGGHDGGFGGGLTGGTGYQCGSQSSWVGYGGTQSAGGAVSNDQGQGCTTTGQLGTGGNGACTYGGGGGGGYYGGGGGSYGGGGGGSSFVTVNGTTGVVHTQAFQTGAGQITINY